MREYTPREAGTAGLEAPAPPPAQRRRATGSTQSPEKTPPRMQAAPQRKNP